MTSRNGPLVVPGYVVDWRTTSWPLRMWSRMVSAADRTGARSGSLVVVIGVGTQTKIASAALRSVSAGEQTRRPSASAACSRSSLTSSIGEVPALSSATRTAKASMPSTVNPASANEIARGRPT
jgi:hypothetical protein